MNSTPHTSHFLVESQRRTWLKAQLILRDSAFLFLLSTFPPIVFFIYLVFSFFHDVEHKYPVHSR